MVFFFFIVINIIMTFINIFFMMFSLVSIEISNISIYGTENILNLAKSVFEKNYLQALNYIKFNLIIRIRIFQKFTLLKITIKNKTIKKIEKFIIRKFILKNNSSNIETDKYNENKIKKIVEKNNNSNEAAIKNTEESKNKREINKKKKSKKINSKIKKALKNLAIKILIKSIKIAELKLDFALGLSRADATAISLGILNSAISAMLALYQNLNNKNKISVDKNSIKYFAKPIYSQNIELKSNLLIGVSSKLY